MICGRDVRALHCAKSARLPVEAYVPFAGNYDSVYCIVALRSFSV